MGSNRTRTGGEGEEDQTVTTAEKFVYDGQDIVLDFYKPDGGSFELARRYLYGPGIDQVLAQENVDQALTDPDRVYWMLTDNLGTVRDLVDATGAAKEHYRYDAFGKLLEGDTSLTRYLYTAREFDVDTGLQYNRNRWYDSNTGRFLSEDPIGFAGDPSNLYRYVGNGPTNGTDPSGLAIMMANFQRNSMTGGMFSEARHFVEHRSSYVSLIGADLNNMSKFQYLHPGFTLTGFSAARLTPDQQWLLSLTGGAARLEPYVANIFEAIRRTRVHDNVPILGSGALWPETFGCHCIRWISEYQRQENLLSPPVLLRSKLVTLDYPGRGGPNHQVLLYKMPGGIAGVDNGAFGKGDRIFDPRKVLKDNSVPRVTRCQLKKAVDQLSG